MEFLRSFIRRHFAGKPVVVSPNVLQMSAFSPATEDFSHLKANERIFNFKTAYPTSVYVFKIVSCSPWADLCLIYDYFTGFSGTGLPFVAVLSVQG